MKKCLITLTGQGDTYILLVNKEIFEWILSPVEFPLDTNPQKEMNPVLKAMLGALAKRVGVPIDGEEYDLPRRVSSVYDPTTPLILQEHMKARGYDPLCNVTCGSPDNDKALFVSGCADLDDENVRSFYSVRELMKFCKKHKIDIVDEWEGGIY